MQAVEADHEIEAILVGQAGRIDDGEVKVGTLAAQMLLASVGETDLVFTRENGAALDPEAVTRYFRRAIKESTLPPIRLHDLRHTHATLALQAGIHPKVVSERLGHATISITLYTYLQAIPEMQEEAALIAGLVFAASE